jgi:uncharacterized protein DUF6941
VNLRALLLCEDVRIEVDGTLTLIGVRNDRLLVRLPESGPIVLQTFVVLVTVSGLGGYDRIGFRAAIMSVDDMRVLDTAPSYQEHAPSADEHNFIFSYASIAFPTPGTYEFVVELEVVMQSVKYRHRFTVEGA